MASTGGTSGAIVKANMSMFVKRATENIEVIELSVEMVDLLLPVLPGIK